MRELVYKVEDLSNDEQLYDELLRDTVDVYRRKIESLDDPDLKEAKDKELSHEDGELTEWVSIELGQLKSFPEGTFLTASSIADELYGRWLESVR